MSSLTGYEALVHGAALVRRTDRGVLRLNGADRAIWLQGLVTNDVRAVQAGQRVYSAYLTPQGRMITDLWVIPTPDALLLDVPAPLAAGLRDRLDGLIFAEDVVVEDVSGEVGCHYLTVGAGAPGAPGAAGATGAGILVPDCTYGVPGLAVYGRLDAVLEAHGLGSLAHAQQVDLETFDVMRVEAGVPRFLVDMTEDTIPLEAGIEARAISFTKGCYVGQEIIVRVTQRGGGRVAKRLVGLTLEASVDDPAVPAAASSIHAGGRAVGHVTSAVPSPRVGRVIGLGYVHRDFVSPGTPVEVVDDRQRVSAAVTALPFVAPRS